MYPFFLKQLDMHVVTNIHCVFSKLSSFSHAMSDFVTESDPEPDPGLPFEITINLL
jgi:hypothetical protein